MSTSSTPIQVDTKEVGHIYVLLPTLEYSVLVGCPTVPGLTVPINMVKILQQQSPSYSKRGWFFLVEGYPKA